LAWVFTDFLFLTTVVSLEAIYLSILIQLSVNLQSKKIQSIQEDVEGIQEDVEEIQEDVEEINEEEDDDEDDESIKEIKSTLDKLLKEVIALKKKQK
jgi:peptidoglycan hydrolase CwlO-like protein